MTSHGMEWYIHQSTCQVTCQSICHWSWELRKNACHNTCQRLSDCQTMCQDTCPNICQNQCQNKMTGCVYIYIYIMPQHVRQDGFICFYVGITLTNCVFNHDTGSCINKYPCRFHDHHWQPWHPCFQ